MANYSEKLNKKNAYSEKLKDPRWQKKRLEILNRDEFSCQKCFDDQSTLHVHHRRYFGGKEPWDIDNKFLVTLCESCHDVETEFLPEVSSDIVSILKEKFFSDNIKTIAGAFVNTPIYYDPHVTASIIEFWLGTPERFEELGDKYFAHLRIINGNPATEDMPF